MKYCPFPKLWNKFEFHGDVLQRPFEILDRAAKLQAMQGDAAALAFLKGTTATNLPWSKHSFTATNQEAGA